MAKYNYDKTALKGLGVGAFLNEVKVREQKIEEADNTPSPSIFNSNKLAASLHPALQHAKVEKVVDHGSAKLYVLGPNPEKGTKQLAYFRAGQYLSIAFDIDGVKTCRPYTICSNPKDALASKSTYSILVKAVDNGLVSNYIIENWKPGTEVMCSAPIGHYFYTNLRDAKQVIALAGGSGITPFYSMACAIDSGIEDFNLTILYGSRTADDILLKDELAALEKRCAGKLKVVHVLSDEEKKGYKNGFIDANMVKEFAGDVDYSLYICGPSAMLQAMGMVINELKLSPRRYRMEVPGEILDLSNIANFKDEKKGTMYKVKLHIRDDVKELEVPSDVTLMRGIENAGIVIPSDCRSGECGWCRSRLISGDVFMLSDKRRGADKKFNWIHPCRAYAKSDIEMEIFPTY